MRAVKAIPKLVVLAAATLCGCGARTDPTLFEATPNGPSGSTCGAQMSVIDETLVDDVFDTNDFPSLAFDAAGAPVVLLEQWDGGFRGGLGRRGSGGDWKVTGLPVRTASGAIALGAPGPIAIAAYDGAGSSSLLVENGDRFDVSPMPTHDPIRSTSLWRDRKGALHFLTEQNTAPSSTYVFYDGVFHTFPLDPKAMHPSIVLGREGDADVPWVVWSTPRPSSSESDVRAWRGDTHAVESVTVGGYVFDVAVGVDGRPVAVAQETGESVALFVRGADGTWQRRPTSVDIHTDFMAIVPFCGSTSLLVARNVGGGTQLVLLRDGVTADTLVNHADMTIRSLRAIVDDDQRIHVVYDAVVEARFDAFYALIAPSTP